jgi:hypothetical protein
MMTLASPVRPPTSVMQGLLLGARRETFNETWESTSKKVGSRRPRHERVMANLHASEGIVSHSADRLAMAIVIATSSPTDLRTRSAWGQRVGVSRGALRAWCTAAHVQARSCLDFLRVLRAVVLSEPRAWDLFSTLDVVDERSLIRLLDRGGVRELSRSEKAPTIDEFMTVQRFQKTPRWFRPCHGD